MGRVGYSSDMDRFHWLDPHDADLWATLWAFVTWVPANLDEHLKRSEQMSLIDYLAMLAIAQADDQQITMSQLARTTRTSASRLSHVMDRLEEKGLTARTRSTEDRRSTIASLTPEGTDFMVRATPTMIHRLRESIFEAVTVEEADQLNAIIRKILANTQGVAQN